MPRLEPVMTATLPVRSNGVFFTKKFLSSFPDVQVHIVDAPLGGPN